MADIARFDPVHYPESLDPLRNFDAWSTA